MEYKGLMRIVQIIVWISFGIVIIGGVFLMLPSLIFPFFALTSPRIPEPEITYGEFPFRIEYELNGEVHVIEDIVIAEFNGFVFSAGSMSRERQWQHRLASGRENVSFEGNPWVYFLPGSANYYMGELVGTSIGSIPHIKLIEPNGDSFLDVTDRIVIEEAHEILKEYGITLIDWEISEPIINNFGD